MRFHVYILPCWDDGASRPSLHARSLLWSRYSQLTITANLPGVNSRSADRKIERRHTMGTRKHSARIAASTALALPLALVIAACATGDQGAAQAPAASAAKSTCAPDNGGITL